VREWQNIMTKALAHGQQREDRTGVGTLALFGEQCVFDNRTDPHGTNTFPAVTAKRLAFGQVKAELACFLRGYDNLEEFHSMGCHIWDGNGNDEGWLKRRSREGDLGRIYGAQWRGWRSVARTSDAPEGAMADVWVTDQIASLVKGMRRDPFGRRHLVTAFNPGEIGDVCLPPCHVMFQAWVRRVHTADGGGYPAVDLRVDMRSVDLFLGLPFDIASYALLQRLLAKELGMHSGWLVFQLGDAHVYLNHLAQAHVAIGRDPMEPPGLWLRGDASLDRFHPAQAELVGYRSHDPIAAPLNV
jgi:thymidylate synthase